MANPFLTLPPVIGNKYLYKNKGSDELIECEIVQEEEYRDSTIYRSRDEAGGNWSYWPDGKAKIFHPKEAYVAILVEDIIVSHVHTESEELKKLRGGHEEMMNRLKELGA